MERRRRRNSVVTSDGPQKLVDHPELHDDAVTRRIIAAAEERLRDSGPAGDQRSEAILFKALHACALLLADRGTGRKIKRLGPRKLSVLYQQILDRLVNDNVGLVYSMLQRYGFRKGDRDEVVSAGFWALFQAARHFDPWRGYRFSTYACRSILRGFQQVARRDTRLERIKVRLPEDYEISDDRTDGQNLDGALLAERLRLALRGSECELTPKERRVLELRFMQPDGDVSQTLKTVGQAFRLSKERIRQIQLSALEKLRITLANDPVLRKAGLMVPGELN